MSKRPEVPHREEERPYAPPPDNSGYTDEEEAEVRKRLEDLGYVE
jgi:hypothetical protein